MNTLGFKFRLLLFCFSVVAAFALAQLPTGWYPAGSNWPNAVHGLTFVVSAVQRQPPNVRWENCEDGGNMMTYSMTPRYVTSIAADDSADRTEP